MTISHGTFRDCVVGVYRECDLLFNLLYKACGSQYGRRGRVPQVVDVEQKPSETSNLCIFVADVPHSTVHI